MGHLTFFCKFDIILLLCSYDPGLLMTTAIGYDNFFLQHLTGDHPERTARLTSITEALQGNGLWDSLAKVEQRPDPDEWIRSVHCDEYIERLKTACQNDLPYIDCADSAICPDSFEIARCAVAVGLAAADMVMNSQVENVFCAIRPPRTSRRA